MPKYTNSFRNPKYREESIIDPEGNPIGTVPPETVLYFVEATGCSAILRRKPPNLCRVDHFSGDTCP